MTLLGVFIGLLTVVLVFTCVFLMLLILLQLPKKEAGAGVAFGGGATDALFGAGSGNALTKMTKYSATIFLGIALTLSVLNSHRAGQATNKLDEALKKREASSALIPQATPTNSLLRSVPTLTPTNAAAPKTETPAANPVTTNVPPASKK